MKYLSILLLSSILWLSIPAAASEGNDQSSIAQLIQEVKTSRNDARRKAMNRLKLKLRSVNQETRRQVMLQLRQNFAAGHQNRLTHPTPNGQKHNHSPNMQGATHGNGARQFSAPHSHIPQQPAVQAKPQNRPGHTPSSVPRQRHGGHP